MNEVSCYAKTDLKKGQPESLLGNWTADVCLEEAQDLFQDTIDMVLFNNGGLRLISEGDITKREIYQLMPSKMNWFTIISLDDVDDLMNYLKYTGVSRQHFLNGLKKMSCLFMHLLRIILLMVAIKCAFSTTSQNVLGVKMRDAIIQYCFEKDTIASQLDNRYLYFMADE